MTGVKQFDEEELLRSVLDVFWRQGLRSTSMQDLAAASGVQRGSLYNAYGNKDELFLLAFERYASRFLGAARLALSDADLRRALVNFFNVAITNMTAGSPSKGCLATKTATDAALITEPIRRALRVFLDQLESIVLEALSTGPKRQRLTIEPVEAARLIVTLTRGLAVFERIYRTPKRLKETAAALIEVLLKPEEN